MIIYIAGRMSGRLPVEYVQDFSNAQARLTVSGHTVLNPALLPDSMPSDRYLPICMAMLDQADAICMIGGEDSWRNSKGALIEYHYAKYQGKLVFNGVENVPKVQE